MLILNSVGGDTSNNSGGDNDSDRVAVAVVMVLVVVVDATIPSNHHLHLDSINIRRCPPARNGFGVSAALVVTVVVKVVGGIMGSIPS